MKRLLERRRGAGGQAGAMREESGPACAAQCSEAGDEETPCLAPTFVRLFTPWSASSRGMYLLRRTGFPLLRYYLQCRAVQYEPDGQADRQGEAGEGRIGRWRPGPAPGWPAGGLGAQRCEWMGLLSPLLRPRLARGRVTGRAREQKETAEGSLSAVA